MKKLAISLSAATLLLLVAILSAGSESSRETGDLQARIGPKNPWTHLDLNNRRENFQFVIVTDRTGGRRPGVFAAAVEKINLLQPEFVISVGDLIEGGTEDRGQLALEWAEFEGLVSNLEMPFFYVPGNHDITNQVMRRLWDRKFGRSYYSFRYHDVLFLCLNTEDPSGQGRYHISTEQRQWVKTILDEHENVRWTFVFLHKPVWMYDVDHAESGWTSVEEALGKRPYTVFSGHHHSYKKWVRNGREYYMLATTGGTSKLRGKQAGEFDHVVWVTLKDSGPVLANLMLDGIEDKNIGPR